ncbi:MAG TPA: hypothetical protein PLJ21_08690, partial [Pseudobdellovibrionaceae bacterium]|nr:hypothetical protein [Pseudobdellovibrionaceae bacterium]
SHGNHWEFYFSQNALIIQIVVSIILLLTIFVIYRSYFSKSASSGEGVSLSSGAIDGSSIEKTLERILEKQMELQKKVQVSSLDGADYAGNPEVEAKLIQTEAKLDEMKKEVEEKQQQIQVLQAAGGTVGGSNEASSDLKNKLLELETKLAEYEIISEDLADLSKFKSENISLKKEIEELKKNKPSFPQAQAQAPAPAPTSAPASAPEPAASPVAAPAPATSPDPAPAAAPAVAAEPIVAAPVVATVSAEAPSAEALVDSPTVSVGPETGEINDVIDDDLMKEFEMAVAQQKKGLETPEAKEPEKSEIKTAEAGELIEQFENFVKKD